MLQNGEMRNLGLQQDTLKIESGNTNIPINFPDSDSVKVNDISLLTDSINVLNPDTFLTDTILKPHLISNIRAIKIDSVKRETFVRPKKVWKPKPLYNADSIPYIIAEQNISNWKFLEEIPATKPVDTRDVNQQFIISLDDNNLSKKNFYVENTGSKVNIIPVERVFSRVNDWLLGFIIISFIFLAWSKVLYSKYMKPLISGVFNFQLAHKLYRDKNITLQRISINLNFIYILNLSLFIFLLLNHFKINLTSLKIYDFLLCFAFVYTLYIIKYILFYLVGYLFLTGNEFAEYHYHTSLLNKVMGLFLLPLILGAAYALNLTSSGFIYTGIGLLLFFYLLRISKGFRIFMKKDISIFYMFLYLCALEIFPLMIFYKYISIYLYKAI